MEMMVPVGFSQSLREIKKMTLHFKRSGQNRRSLSVRVNVMWPLEG